MSTHFSTVLIHDEDDGRVTLTINCRTCGVTVLQSIEPAHLITLSRVLAATAKRRGLDSGMTTPVGETPHDDPALKNLAEQILTQYIKRREQ